MIEQFFSSYNIDLSTLNSGDVVFYKGDNCFGVKSLCECFEDCVKVKVDRCEMVECLGLEAGKYLRVSADGTCIEAVDIAQVDGCGVKVSETDDCCQYLHQKIVSPNNSILISKGEGNTPGCEVLEIRVNTKKDCVKAFDLCDRPTNIPECSIDFRENYFPCIKEKLNCGSCEDECSRYEVEFCPELGKIQYKTDACCLECFQAFRSRTQLNESYTISIGNDEEKKYYCTAKRIPRLDALGYRWVGGVQGGSFSELQGGGLSTTAVSYENQIQRHGSVAMHGALFSPHVGDIDYLYKGGYETNKAAHGVKHIVIAIECDGGVMRSYELDSWRDSGIQGERYGGQPEGVNGDYGPYGSNSTTSAYTGVQSSDEDVKIYSMGRSVERRGFVVGGRDYFPNPTWFIPGIKISTTISGDDEAKTVSGQVSVIGGVTKGLNYEDGARLSIRCIDSETDRKMMRKYCEGCQGIEMCNIFDEDSEFGNAVPFVLPGTGAGN